VGEILALCVASHHSGLIDCIAPDRTDNLSRHMAKVDLESHLDEAWANADKVVIERKERCLQDPELVATVGGVIARICQNGANETIRRFKVGLLVRFLFNCLIDPDRTDTADSAKPASAPLGQHGQCVQWSVLADLLERKLEQFPSSSAVDFVAGTCFRRLLVSFWTAERASMRRLFPRAEVERDDL
jgi:CRISPR-associated endonuclease/helicase Cas3